MAAELGELVMSIEADNLKLKAKLKQSEQLTEKAGKAMSKSLNQVERSSVDASQGFILLEKAAAATGFTWLTQIKNIGELIWGLSGLKSALTISTTAYGAEATAIALNTKALSANVAARTAQRAAITAMPEPWEGLARGRAARGIRTAGVRPARIAMGTAAASSGGQLAAMATYMQRAKLAQIGKGLMVAGKATAITAAATAVGELARRLWGLWQVRKKNAEVLKASQELEKRLSLQVQTRRTAIEKEVSTLQRRLQVARKGLTGAAAHEVLYQGTKPQAILDLELQIMRIQERRANVAQHHARLDAEREQRLQRQLELQRRLTEEARLEQQARREQIVAQRAQRITTGLGASPMEFRKHVFGMIQEQKVLQRYQERMIGWLKHIINRYPGLREAAKTVLGRFESQAETQGGRGMLMSARGLSGMPVPRLTAGGFGAAKTESREKKKVDHLKKIEQNTGRLADAVAVGGGMAD